MKSVGEAMAIGRTFKEAFLKGIRSLEIGSSGILFSNKVIKDSDPGELKRRLVSPTDRRMWAVFEALDAGWSVEKVFEATKIDPWFLTQFSEIVELRREASLVGFRDMSSDLLRTLKRFGFGDEQLGNAIGVEPAVVAARRAEDNLRASYKRIDTCAAEFESFTPYLYGTYETECESQPTDRLKVIILGSGPNRIGQGIEFDYCCCHAAFALREIGY